MKPQLCGTPLDPRATGFQFVVAAEPLSLSVVLCQPEDAASTDSKLAESVEAETDSHMQAEIGSDF